MRQVLVVWCVCGLTVVALAQEAPPTKAEVSQQVAQALRALDAPQFAVRRRAETQLLEIGSPALAALLEAERSGSAEVRTRARRVARLIDDREIGRSFDRMSRFKIDADIDTEEALWLLARIVDPLAARDELTRGLDRLAADVRQQLGGSEPKKADPLKVMTAIREALHVRGGLTGSMTTNDSPASSSAIRVLAAKRGQPAVLAEIVVAVGRRLDLPLATIAVPGGAMVKYDGKLGPKGYAGGDLVLDPEHGFRLFTKLDELTSVLQQEGIELDPADHLRPLSHRVTVARLLRQLSQDFARAGRDDKATQTASYLRLIDRSGELEFGEP